MRERQKGIDEYVVKLFNSGQSDGVRYALLTEFFRVFHNDPSEQGLEQVVTALAKPFFSLHNKRVNLSWNQEREFLKAMFGFIQDCERKTESDDLKRKLAGIGYGWRVITAARTGESVLRTGDWKFPAYSWSHAADFAERIAKYGKGEDRMSFLIKAAEANVQAAEMIRNEMIRRSGRKDGKRTRRKHVIHEIKSRSIAGNLYERVLEENAGRREFEIARQMFREKYAAAYRRDGNEVIDFNYQIRLTAEAGIAALYCALAGERREDQEEYMKRAERVFERCRRNLDEMSDHRRKGETRRDMLDFELMKKYLEGEREEVTRELIECLRQNDLELPRRLHIFAKLDYSFGERCEGIIAGLKEGRDRPY
ncbi:hypothetical protein J4410_06510 [Candidatus Woesearchaeota archaeon]|nr:hypothetical protein [Candidatus Woesearchaeota archaeon]